ncbi:hypothetical protein [Algibacter sp. 2305UL17-15]|uniref:hypothetical protein n=1 Tax=Algibacter sp. 2305UL17-15 TaxID=3231268 RepID=UPI00345ABB05
MKDKTQILHSITKRILITTTENEVEAVKHLNEFYTQFETSDDIEGDIHLTNGIALSKKHAADCIKDYKRTSRFLKGVYKAIVSCAENFPDTELNILYAGCGPYATLVLPLLSFFKPEQLNITLLDINKSSIESIKRIVSELKMDSYFGDIIVADATTYKYPETLNLHLVISETMFNALTKEPQVAVTDNLAPQLIEKGILIPEEIDVSMGYSFFSKEPFLNQFDNEYYVSNTTNKPIERDAPETLFVLNKKTSKNVKLVDSNYFESRLFTIPTDFQNKPDICLYTRIKIFDSIDLQNEDSLITNPFCIASLYNLPKESKFRINYNIKNSPNWGVTIY